MYHPSRIIVRFAAEGFHCWPEAEGKRAYLASPHRHLFHVDVIMAVAHDDREVEFHDLLAFARQAFGSGDFGRASCETLAKSLIQKLRAKYGERAISVAVYEDGEVGAMVDFEPDREPSS